MKDRLGWSASKIVVVDNPSTAKVEHYAIEKLAAETTDLVIPFLSLPSLELPKLGYFARV